MRQALKTIVLMAVLAALGYYFRAPLSGIFGRLSSQFLPCAQPIAYSLGAFDARFGISQKNFLAAVAQAEALWEASAGKELFAYKDSGYLKINLLYDSRQQTTVELKKLGGVVDENRASYDALKSQYETLVAQFNIDQAQYSAEVAGANSRGGASKQEYERLNAVRLSLNERANSINDMASTLNDLAAKLNITVAKFNEVGASRGEEFSEGLYISEPAGQHIDIYEYSSQAKLVRVLAHELGHALGLDHVADSNAIMYRLNQGSSQTLTADDLSALKTRCRLD